MTLITPRKLGDLFKVPPNRPRSSPWLTACFGALGVTAGIWFVLSVIPDMSAPALKDKTAAFLFALRAVQTAVVGGWIAWSRPWRPAGAGELRMGRLLMLISAILLMPAVATLPLEPSPLDALPYYVVIALCLMQIFWLSRRGFTRLAAAIVTANMIMQLVALNSLTLGPGPVSTPLVYGLIILVSGFTLGWWSGLALAVLLPAAMPLLAGLGLLTIQPDWAAAATYAVILVAYAGLTALYTRGLEQALATAAERAHEVELAQATLQLQNRQLADQALALQISQAAQQQTIERQEQLVAQAVAELRERSMELHAIQTPLIPVAPGVLVAPLVGAWDAARAEQFLQTMLTRIERERAHTALLDLTGVTVTTTQVAEMLREAVQGGRMLGCRCVLVGVQPETAQVLVNMSVGVSDMMAARDLAEGVSRALNARAVGSSAGQVAARRPGAGSP